MSIIEGALGAPLQSAGAPGAGTDEVQTLTIGGTPSGGTFRLKFGPFVTAPIAWSNNNTTLLNNIEAALEALPGLGSGSLALAATTLTAGVGDLTITFDGANVAKKVQPTIEVHSNSMTGTAPTVAVVETTPGVSAFGRGAPKGAVASDTTNGKLYINSGTAQAPTWTVVGTQT